MLRIAISSMTSNIRVVNPDMRINSLKPVRYGVASPTATAGVFVLSGSPSDLEDDVALLSLTMSAASTVTTTVSLVAAIFSSSWRPEAVSSTQRLGLSVVRRDREEEV